MITEDRTDELKDFWLDQAEKRAFKVLQENSDYQFSVKVGWDREAERLFQNELDNQYEIIKEGWLQ